MGCYLSGLKIIIYKYLFIFFKNNTWSQGMRTWESTAIDSFFLLLFYYYYYLFIYFLKLVNQVWKQLFLLLYLFLLLFILLFF